MRAISVITLAIAARITATTTGPVIDVSSYGGEGRLALNSSPCEGVDNTSTVKIEHADLAAGPFSDSGVAFAPVTNAAGSGQQTLGLNVDRFKRYIRTVTTLAGTTPAVTSGVQLVA